MKQNYTKKQATYSNGIEADRGKGSLFFSSSSSLFFCLGRFPVSTSQSADPQCTVYSVCTSIVSMYTSRRQTQTARGRAGRTTMRTHCFLQTFTFLSHGINLDQLPPSPGLFSDMGSPKNCMKRTLHIVAAAAAAAPATTNHSLTDAALSLSTSQPSQNVFHTDDYSVHRSQCIRLAATLASLPPRCQLSVCLACGVFKCLAGWTCNSWRTADISVRRRCMLRHRPVADPTSCRDSISFSFVSSVLPA